MNTEAKFSRWLIDKVFSDCHVQRIETSTASGVPDMNVCWKGKEFWVETKLYVGGNILLRPYQWAWINRRREAGGNGFVIADHGDTVYTHSFRGLRACRKGKYMAIEMCVAEVMSFKTPTGIEFQRTHIRNNLIY